MFRSVIQDLHGPDVFVTSLTGESVLIYPLPVWLDMEAKLARLPGSHPTVIKYLDLVNYYGQAGELDAQGRVLIPSELRESASMAGDVRVFGRITYLEVWNRDRFAQKMQRDPWTNDDGVKLADLGK